MTSLNLDEVLQISGEVMDHIRNDTPTLFDLGKLLALCNDYGRLVAKINVAQDGLIEIMDLGVNWEYSASEAIAYETLGKLGYWDG